MPRNRPTHLRSTDFPLRSQDHPMEEEWSFQHMVLRQQPKLDAYLPPNTKLSLNGLELTHKSKKHKALIYSIYII